MLHMADPRVGAPVAVGQRRPIAPAPNRSWGDGTHPSGPVATSSKRVDGERARSGEASGAIPRVESGVSMCRGSRVEFEGYGIHAARCPTVLPSNRPIVL